MFYHSKTQGFTAIEVIVVIVIAVILMALLLPMLGRTRCGGSRQMANNTQLRGIHQGMFTFAQSNKMGGNDGYFPGLDSSGNVIPDGEATGYSGDGTQPAAQLRMMLDGNFFTPDYIINPADARAVEYEFSNPNQADPAHPMTRAHYSYALLSLAELADGLDEDEDHRSIEWKETLNTSAVMLSDRAIGTARADISSVFTEPGSGDWRGGVTKNDNSTAFETSAEFEQTKYGNSDVNALDHLFEDAPDATDALLVHADAGTAYSAD